MPRDLMTVMILFISPPLSTDRRELHVSMSEEMSAPLFSGRWVAWSDSVRLVKQVVMPSFLKKSITRVRSDRASTRLPLTDKLLIGSITTTEGLYSRTILWRSTRCISKPY